MIVKKTNSWHYKPNQNEAPQSTRGGALWVILLILLPVIPVAAFLLFPTFFSSQISFLEKTPPIIELAAGPSALGLGESTFILKLGDAGAGLDEIVGRVTQGNQSFDVLKEKLSEHPTEKEVQFSIDAKSLGLREGFIDLHLMAFDASFWSNRAEIKKEFRILYVKPRVEVLTAMHNVAQGGAGLVFYRHRAGEISESGIMVGNEFFRGFPATYFDPEFGKLPSAKEGKTDVFGAFFAVPKDFDGDIQKLVVVARDVAGNQVSAPINYRILNRKFKNALLKISSTYVRTKMVDLLPGYFSASGDKKSIPDAESATPAELIKSFRTINENYRALLAKRIVEILSKPLPQRYWSGAFSRAIAGAPTSGFGDIRSYEMDGEPAGGSAHDGIDLAAVANTQVRPAEKGKVIFADDLGIYGNAVIIDHGLGITSLYGHLSAIVVQVGDEVTPDTVIGRSGATGLAGGDHLHFEIRVGGKSVTPIEWWDEHWVHDHVLQRIEQVKEQMQREY